MQNTGLDESQAGIKTAGKNINNLRYADDTTLMAESKEELEPLDECKKAKWLSGEALQIAVKRGEVKSKGEKERYKHLKAEFQRIAKRDKKAFFSDQCKEIEENNRMGKTRDLFKKIHTGIYCITSLLPFPKSVTQFGINPSNHGCMDHLHPHLSV